MPDTLNMTRGLIPLPTTEEHLVDVAERCTGDNRGWDDLGKRTIRGVVLHRSQGTWAGNISHFDSHCPGALTDLQVHHQDGRMMRFVRLVAPPASTEAPSGWANGVVHRATNGYGDGRRFIERYGIGAVNRDLESCEITGFFRQPGSSVTQDDPVSVKAWATLAQWIASRAHDYGITWETFPLIPGEGNRSFVIWHQEMVLPEFSLTSTSKICPGRVVVEGTDELIAAVREIMRAAQTKDTPSTTTTAPPPSPYPAKRIPAPDHMTAQGHVLTFNDPNRFYATVGQTIRTAPSRDAPAGTATPIKQNRRYTFDYRTVEEIEGEVWLVSKAGSWCLAKGFKP